MDLSGTSKSELAYQFLLRQLIQAKIPPNAPLRIPALGKESGLGVTPMREALRRLESERFVVMENNRGFRASAVSLAELADLEDSRLVVETALLTESIRLGDDDWEARVMSAHYLLDKTPEPFDTSDFDTLQIWSTRHRNFHKALLSASQSQWLTLFYNQISNHLDRHFFCMFTGEHRDTYLGRTDLQQLSRTVLGIEHHTRLMNAALHRKEKEAVRLLSEHVGFTRSFFARVQSNTHDETGRG